MSSSGAKRTRTGSSRSGHAVLEEVKTSNSHIGTHSHRHMSHVNARRLFLDSASIIGLIVAVASITWIVSGERTRIDNKIEKLYNKVEAFITAYDLRIADRYTRSEHNLWCLRAERANPKWACPPLDPISDDAVVPKIGGRVNEDE